jgi:hypothetical protein
MLRLKVFLGPAMKLVPICDHPPPRRESYLRFDHLLSYLSFPIESILSDLSGSEFSPLAKVGSADQNTDDDDKIYVGVVRSL